MKYQVKALPHQREFAESKSKFTALVGGYRSGKSYAIILRYVYLSMLRKGNVKLLVLAPTFRLVRDILVASFVEYLQEKGIHYSLNKSSGIMKIYNVIPGEIWFRTGSDPERIIGFEVTDAIIDEFDLLRLDIQKLLWERTGARISGAPNGTLAVTTTPEGYKYTYRLFIKQKIGRLIRAKTTDNPYIPKDYIAGLRKQYDKKLVERYINGSFINITGNSAYYSFNRDINVVKTKYKPILHKPIHIGIDFNVNPMTAVVAQKLDNNNLIIFDEFYLKNSNTKSMTTAIENKYPNLVKYVYPDLSGNKRSTNAALGKTDIVILKNAGWKVIGNKRLRVKDRLAITNNALDKRLVVISESNEYLIRDLEQVQLDDNGSIISKDKELTHISDAFTYLIERIFKHLYKTI